MTYVILGMAGSSIQLVPDGTLLFHMFLILLMVVVLNRTLFRPVNKILQDREEMGQGALAEASEIRRNVEEDLRKYEEGLRLARVDGYRETESQRRQELSQREHDLSSLRLELTKTIAREKALLQEQTDQARGILLTEAKVLASQIEERILNPPTELGGIR
jgi:F-type H+-transporting ATPase subunit b